MPSTTRNGPSSWTGLVPRLRKNGVPPPSKCARRDLAHLRSPSSLAPADTLRTKPPSGSRHQPAADGGYLQRMSVPRAVQKGQCDRGEQRRGEDVVVGEAGQDRQRVPA